MSDSGSSQFPTRPAPASGASLLPAKGEVRAQIIDATGKLARVDQPRTVIGEVSKVNRDGTVEVKTDEGTLTLKPRDRAVPAEGQRVEIDVQAGAPPKQAILRPPQQPHTTMSVAESDTPATQITQSLYDKPVTRPALGQTTQANLNEQQALRPAIKPQPVPPTPQPLPEDAIVRLTPLSPAQAKQLIDQIIQLIQVRMMSSAFLSTQAIQSAMTRELTTLVPALPLDAVRNIVQQATQAMATKSPLTSLNDVINNTALTPSLQPMRSPVEVFMRQMLTAGSLLMPSPISGLSTQIMIPQANISFPLPTMTLSADTKLSLLPVTLPSATAPEASAPVINMSQIRQTGFMDARVQNFIPVTASLQPQPAPAVSTILQQTTATMMTAQVITVTPQHFPVLSLMMPGSSEPQLFTMNFPATNLTPGSTLTVLPQSAIPVPSTAAGTTLPTAFELLSGFRWPVFDELLEQQNIQIQTATAQTLANVFPNPAQPGKLPAAALIFIAAVRAGDINAWLGDRNIDAMRRTGKSDAVNRMVREFSGLNKLASEPVTPEWRGISIPLYTEGEVNKIHLYYRHSDHGNDRDQEQAEKGKGTRFIMDINLSQIGDVQLDGYTRGKVLDLAVRTTQPFSAAMRHEMTRRYIHALEAAGLEGALVFQSQPDKWVKITPRPDLLSQSI